MDCDVRDIVASDRRLAASNSKWKVYLERLADHRGNEVCDYMVIEAHHAHKDNVTGVAVLPVVPTGFVLLRSYRHALRARLWELPRGFIDEGETPSMAALRELTEETGLRCAPDDLIPLGFYAPEASTLAGRGALFAAIRCEGIARPGDGEIGLEEVEVIEHIRMLKMVSAGEIEDAGTLIAYYRYCATEISRKLR
jgi:8-oxo-dGTP pyrophosphatase MutT (NUDIX family)